VTLLLLLLLPAVPRSGRVLISRTVQGICTVDDAWYRSGVCLSVCLSANFKLLQWVCSHRPD